MKKILGGIAIMALVACTPKPKSLEATPANVALTKVDEAQQLSVVAHDENGGVVENAKIAFASSDPAVAVVDEAGNVTAKKSGKVVVTAKAGEAAVEVPVTVSIYASLQVPTAPISVKPGDHTTIDAKILDDSGAVVAGKITWTSSDEAIAKVEADGSVLAVAPGTATLTAKAQDLTATVTMEVKARVVSSLAVESDKVEMAVGQTQAIPVNAVDAEGGKFSVPVIWSTKDVKFVQVLEDGSLKALKAGKAKLTATHKDSGKSVVVSLTIKKA